jgi:rRNA maturation RNase YbeY
VALVRSPALTPAQRQVVSAAALGPLLRSSGDRLGLPARAGLAVRLTDDEELRALNARFLGEDATTDVLAFPSDEGGRIGDIAISVERAIAQGVDPLSELRLLAVHGLLHCVGFDHADHAGAVAMSAASRRLLRGEPVPELAPA